MFFSERFLFWHPFAPTAQEELEAAQRRAAALESELKGLQELQKKLISGSCGQVPFPNPYSLHPISNTPHPTPDTLHPTPHTPTPWQ